MIPWTVKYRPKRLAEVVGQDEAISQLLELGSAQKTAKPTKALLLYGPPGCGKTAAVYALANEMNAELIQMNASDFRTAERVEAVLGRAAQQGSLFGRQKILLVDEVDGIHWREDGGGLAAVVKLLKETAFPIFLTANDPWKPSLLPLRALCKFVEFKRVDARTIASLLTKICEREGVKCDRKALLEIAKRNQGDVRASITDLQALAGVTKKVSLEDLEVLDVRGREKVIFDTLRLIFKTEKASTATWALSTADRDPEEVMLWIAENVPLEYEKPEELAEAYHYLSRADVFLGRIRGQFWRLKGYANELMSAGVALAKGEKYRKFTKYRSPTLLRRMAESKEERAAVKSLSQKLAKHLHTSAADVKRSYLQLLRTIVKHNPEALEAISEKLRLSAEEAELLAD